MAQSAAQLHQRAVALNMREQYAQAAHVLDRAQSRATDVDMRARILGTRALILQRTGHPNDAESACRSALELSGTSAATRATLFGQMGVIAMYTGRTADAARWLSEAVQRMDADSIEAARVRVSRSLVDLQLTRIGRAIDDLDRAIEIFARHGADVERGQALHNRAYVQLLRGDLVGALEGMAAARPLAGNTPIALAIGDMDRAEALRDAGLTREAEKMLASIAPVFGRHHMPQSRGEVQFQLARSLLTHDPDEAARTAASAAKRFRELGSETWARRADGIRLRARMLSASVRARAVFDPHEAQECAAALAGFGYADEAAALRLSLDIWQSRYAADDASRPPARVSTAAAIDVRLLAHEARAARAAARGRDALARGHAAAGLDVLARWLQTFGSLELQTSVSMHASGLMFAGLAAAARSGRADVLFEWSERARHLNHQTVSLRPPADPQLAADLTELRQQMSVDPTGAWRLDPRFADIEERTREHQWSAMRGSGLRRRVTLAELKTQLREGTALLSFVYTGADLAVIVVTARHARIVAVPRWQQLRELLPGLRADLDMAASVRSGPMVAVVRRSLDARLTALSDGLVGEAVRVSRAERFVITVPGVLEGTPWSMLPALRGRTLTVARSATRWAGCERGLSVGGGVAVAVGPRVARGAEEADAVAAAWSPAPRKWTADLRGSDATVDAVAALAGRVDLLHVAAHGRHAVDNVLFSGLQMADGTLFGYDLDRVPKVPDVVVLSACEGGRSSLRWGEEAVGMTRLWLHAGTRAVVAAPVIVADDAACELLGAMHAGLATGIGPSEALARASIDTGIVAPFQVYGTGF